MSAPSTAYIALGANLGQPCRTLRTAFAELDHLPQTRLLRASSLYRSAPHDCPPGQPDFINAVAALATHLEPEALLAALFDLEQRHGRVRLARNTARTLDLDLLLYDAIAHVSPQLTLPHPRLHLRAFVLVPLAEIAPDLQLPGRGRLTAWLPAVATQNIARLA